MQSGFIFDNPTAPFETAAESPYKVLITTRVLSLLCGGAVQEVFVRILSEHEAVKLLLTTAGRRPSVGRCSAVYNQGKSVVKGCGNSPLGILLVGHAQKQQSQLEYELASMDGYNEPVQSQSGRCSATRKFHEQFDENRGRKRPSRLTIQLSAQQHGIVRLSGNGHVPSNSWGSRSVERADSVRRFQGGDLDGIKERSWAIVGSSQDVGLP